MPVCTYGVFTYFPDARKGFLCRIPAGVQVLHFVSKIYDVSAPVRHHRPAVFPKDIGQRLKDLVIVQRHAQHRLQLFPVVELARRGDLPLFLIHRPLYPHVVSQTRAPPFPVQILQRDKRILVFHLDTVRKKADLVDGVMIRLGYGEKGIRHLRILFISRVIVQIFFFYDLFNIGRIGKIIQQACKNLDLAVDIFPCLLQDRLHILRLVPADHGAHTAVAVQDDPRHRN